MMDMLAKDLQGLYHVVSRECSSKYDFGEEWLDCSDTIQP